MTLSTSLLFLVFTTSYLHEPAKAPAKPQQTGKAPELQRELVKRMKAEQDVRFEFIKLNPSNKPLTPEDREKPEMKAVFEKMHKIDNDNLTWFKGVVEKHGWPGFAMVGRDGAQGAFLIAQHAGSDLDFMAKCLELLKPAYKAGDA